MSMPSAGFLHFHRQELPKWKTSAKRCQCPQRAFSISTATSRKPHKHWLSRPFLAGICLNILKSGIFLIFSGMFTICSYLTSFQPSTLILYFIFLIRKSINLWMQIIFSKSETCIFTDVCYFSGNQIICTFFGNILKPDFP